MRFCQDSMNTITEKLNAIAAKCRELLAQDVAADPKAKAGWRTTLAAIAELDDMSEEGAYVLGSNIIAAWEGLL